jgi:hypothetical protein
MVRQGKRISQKIFVTIIDELDPPLPVQPYLGTMLQKRQTQSRLIQVKVFVPSSMCSSIEVTDVELYNLEWCGRHWRVYKHNNGSQAASTVEVATEMRYTYVCLHQ